MLGKFRRFCVLAAVLLFACACGRTADISVGRCAVPRCAVRLWENKTVPRGYVRTQAEYRLGWNAGARRLSLSFLPAADGAAEIESAQKIEENGATFYVTREAGSGDTQTRTVMFYEGELFVKAQAVSWHESAQETEWLSFALVQALAHDPETAPEGFEQVEEIVTVGYESGANRCTMTLEPENGVKTDEWLAALMQLTPGGRSTYGGSHSREKTQYAYRYVQSRYGWLELHTETAAAQTETPLPELSEAFADQLCDELEAGRDPSQTRFVRKVEWMADDADHRRFDRVLRSGTEVSVLNEAGKTIVSGHDVIALPYVYAVQGDDGWRFCDLKTGKPLNGDVYSNFTYSRYEDGYTAGARMTVYRGGKCGIVNGWGELLLAPEKYGFEEIRREEYYCSLEGTSEPMDIVIKEGKWGMLARSGDLVIRPEWEYLFIDDHNGDSLLVYAYGGKGQWSTIRLNTDLTARPPEKVAEVSAEIIDRYRNSTNPRLEVTEEMRYYWSDFANRIGLYWAPFCNAGQAPLEAQEYLFMLWSMDREAPLTRERVERFMRTWFRVDFTAQIVHESSKYFTYRDGVYTPTPMSYRDRAYYNLVSYSKDIAGQYRVLVLDEYTPASDTELTAEQADRVEEEIKSGNTEHFVFKQRQELRFTMSYDEEYGDFPVFFSNLCLEGGAAYWAYDLFGGDPGFRYLAFDDACDADGLFTDETLIYYAIARMGGYSYENGNTPEEYNAVTRKYLGMAVKNFNNALTRLDADGRVYLKGGYSFDSSVFVLLKDIRYDYDRRESVAQCYLVEVSDGSWDADDQTLYERAIEALRRGDLSLLPQTVTPRLAEIRYSLQTGGDGKPYACYSSVRIVEPEVKGRLWIYPGR